MLSQLLRTTAAAALLSASGASAFMKLPLNARQLPANATDVKTIVSPTNVTIRYKEPGKDELGPCNITANLTSAVNPYAWNEVSNLLFLSQPFGVGFSYSEEAVGSFNNVTGAFEPDNEGQDYGRYPIINATEIDTTNLAAVAAYHVLQGFLSALPTLDSEVKSKDFNLWTESYG
ncbi:hypothetical protein SLS54_002229 [Diplodia seriata]